MAAVVRCEWWRLRLAVVLGVAALVVSGVLIRRMQSTARGAADLADEGDYVDASEYERLTGIAKKSYERRLLAAARELMMGEWTVEPDDAPAYKQLGVSEHGSVDDVRLEDNGTEVALVVLFRSDDRPGCVFGWRIPVWPAPAPDDPDEGTPEGYAFILSVNLMELVDLPASLPGSDPDARAITWIVNSVPGTK
jgi:hypothetical protein